METEWWWARDWARSGAIPGKAAGGVEGFEESLGWDEVRGAGTGTGRF